MSSEPYSAAVERAMLLAQIAEAAAGQQTTAACSVARGLHAAAELHFAENLRSGLIPGSPEQENQPRA
jgi:hypothetical protein